MDEPEPDLISSVANSVAPIFQIKTAIQGVALIGVAIYGAATSSFVRWVFLGALGVMAVTALIWITVERYLERRLLADLSLPRGSTEARLARREVLLEGEFSEEATQIAIAELLYLQHEDDQAPVTLFIDVPEGSAVCGFTLLDTFAYLSCPVHTHCRGTATGFTGVLLAAGAPGKRSASKGAKLSIGLPFFGPPESEEQERAQRAAFQETIAILTNAVRPSEVQVSEDLEARKEFSPDAAVVYGLYRSSPLATDPTDTPPAERSSRPDRSRRSSLRSSAALRELCDSNHSTSPRGNASSPRRADVTATPVLLFVHRRTPSIEGVPRAPDR